MRSPVLALVLPLVAACSATELRPESTLAVNEAHAEPGELHPEPGESYPDPGESYPEPGESYPEPGESYPDPGEVGMPPAPVFALPRKALELARPATVEPDGRGAYEWSLAELVERYAKVTGWNVGSDEAWAAQLARERVDFGRALSVPAEHVHTFVEAILNQHGYVLVRPVRVAEHSVLVTVPDPDDDEWLRTHCLPVPLEGIERFRGHTALLVSTVVELRRASLLSESWFHLSRSIVTEELVPLGGTRFVLVLGTGQRVAQQVAMLRDAGALVDRVAPAAHGDAATNEGAP